MTLAFMRKHADIGGIPRVISRLSLGDGGYMLRDWLMSRQQLAMTSAKHEMCLGSRTLM